MKRLSAFYNIALLGSVWAGGCFGATIAWADTPKTGPSSIATTDIPATAAQPATPRATPPATMESISVFVLGAVATPGMVRLPSDPIKKPRLMDAIRAAGGVETAAPMKESESRTTEDTTVVAKPPTADLQGVTARLLRSGGARTIELYGLRESNVTSNVSLREGDIVVVTRAEVATATAAGAVLHPGKHALRERTSAAAFLKMAGFTAKAALQEAYIQRGTERIALDGEALADGRAQGPVLKAGDILQIPTGAGQIELRGALRFPGVRSFRKEMTILDAVGLCGGWGNLADINAMPQVMAETSLLAPGQNSIEITAQSRELPFTIQGVFQSANFAKSAAVAPGQHLVIPERERVTIIGAKRSPHYVAATLSLKAALQAAGGTAENADLAHVVVMGGAGRPQGVVIDKDSAEKLLPGDIVWVAPQSSVAVCGAVQRPRAMAGKSGSTLLDAVKAGGGLSPLAAVDSVAVLRPQNNRLSFLKVDYAKALAGDAASNLPLQAGDIVVVPFREQTNAQSGTRPAVTLTALLSFLVGPPVR